MDKKSCHRLESEESLGIIDDLLDELDPCQFNTTSLQEDSNFVSSIEPEYSVFASLENSVENITNPMLNETVKWNYTSTPKYVKGDIFILDQSLQEERIASSSTENISQICFDAVDNCVNCEENVNFIFKELKITKPFTEDNLNKTVCLQESFVGNEVNFDTLKDDVIVLDTTFEHANPDLDPEAIPLLPCNYLLSPITEISETTFTLDDTQIDDYLYTTADLHNTYVMQDENKIDNSVLERTFTIDCSSKQLEMIQNERQILNFTFSQKSCGKIAAMKKDSKIKKQSTIIKKDIASKNIVPPVGYSSTSTENGCHSRHNSTFSFPQNAANNPTVFKQHLNVRKSMTAIAKFGAFDSKFGLQDHFSSSMPHKMSNSSKCDNLAFNHKLFSTKGINSKNPKHTNILFNSHIRDKRTYSSGNIAGDISTTSGYLLNDREKLPLISECTLLMRRHTLGGKSNILPDANSKNFSKCVPMRNLELKDKSSDSQMLKTKKTIPKNKCPVKQTKLGLSKTKANSVSLPIELNSVQNEKILKSVCVKKPLSFKEKSENMILKTANCSVSKRNLNKENHQAKKNIPSAKPALKPSRINPTKLIKSNIDESGRNVQFSKNIFIENKQSDNSGYIPKISREVTYRNSLLCKKNNMANKTVENKISDENKCLQKRSCLPIPVHPLTRRSSYVDIKSKRSLVSASSKSVSSTVTSLSSIEYCND